MSLENVSLIVDNVTFSSLQQQEFVVNGIVVPCISIVGMLFNIAILLIFHSKGHFLESTYVYLYDLAFSDLLTLFFFSTNFYGRAFFPDSYDWRVYEVYFYFPFGSMVSNASIFLTVTVTLERYIFIYHPIKSIIYCTPDIARKVNKCIWIFSFFLSMPRFFVMLPAKKGQLAFTAFGTSTSYKVMVWIEFILTSLAPSLLLIIFNLLLILAIHRRRTRQNSLKTATNDPCKVNQLSIHQTIRNHNKITLLNGTDTIRNTHSTPREEGQGITSVENGNQRCQLPGNENNIKNKSNYCSNSMKQKKNNSEKMEIKSKKQIPIDELIEIDQTNFTLNSDKNKENENTKHDLSFSVRKDEELMLKLHKKQKDDFRLTLTLIGVVVVFLLGEVPSYLMSRNTVGAIKGEEVLEEDWYRKALMVCTILVVNQHSTNFIVYCFLNKRFYSFVKNRLITIRSTFGRK